jgi:hypothetical protein
MDYEGLLRIIAQTDSQYAGGDDAAKQAAVAARDAAIAEFRTNAPAPTATTSSGGGGGSGSVAPAAAPPPKPLLPDFKPIGASSNKSVKMAPSDIIQFDDDAVEIALITELLYEDIGATELVNISRSDLIDGQEVIYSPIANLSVIRREYNPNNLIASSALSDYFTRFGINLISRGMYEPYFNSDGDLVVEVDVVSSSGEEIQVEILSNGTISVVEQT